MTFQSLRCLFWFSLVALAPAIFVRAETSSTWPELSPVRLKEEIFGLRFQVALETKGPKAAEAFLKAAWLKTPTPEVKVWVAWTSLYPKAWGIQPLVEPSVAEGMAESAIAAGSAIAADLLGRARIYGDAGISRDEASGYELIKQAAEAGYARAIGREGRFYISGSGRARDITKGTLLINKAAELGSADALAETAADYEYGRALGMPNMPLAKENYYVLAYYDTKGAIKLGEYAQKGVPHAWFLYLLARMRDFNEGYWIAPTVARETFKELEKLQSTDARALVEMGMAHLRGRYAKRDHALAKQLFEQAAPNSDDAKMFLAYMQCHGFAMTKDVDAGVATMEALAVKGSSRAANWLGTIYYWGDSDFPVVRKDPKKAFYYARMAAEKGHLYGLKNLGFCYDHGIGTPPNYALAAIVNWRAYKMGSESCKEQAIRDLAFVKLP